MNIKDYSAYIFQLWLIIFINHSCLTQTDDTYVLLISNVWHYVLVKVLLVVGSRLNFLHFLHRLAEMLRDDWMRENTNVSYSNGAAPRTQTHEREESVLMSSVSGNSGSKTPDQLLLQPPLCRDDYNRRTCARKRADTQEREETFLKKPVSYHAVIQLPGP